MRSEPLRYGSVCSGIEAATVAWHPMGWQAAWYSEVDPYCCDLLAHHYPDTPNLGDMTKITEDRLEERGRINLLVGGTPCQSFSVAGLRKGLDDPRGNLALEFFRIADRTRPQWLVYENVPGLLSSDEGRAFGSIVGAMAELGYGWAYRILDAQYIRVDGYERAVPQRRRRVFVVGHLGGWQRAAAVLFERACLSGNPAPRREAGEGTAGSVAACLNSGGNNGGFRTGPGEHLAATHIDGGETARSLTSRADGSPCHDRGPDVIAVPGVSPALKARDYKGPSSDGDGDGAPILPVAFHARQDPIHYDNCSLPLEMKQGQAVAFTQNQNASGRNTGKVMMPNMAVRRLVPTECEALQGFPRGYTAIPRANGKPSADGPRYKGLGNSMAIPPMRWIGRRIEMVNQLPESTHAK